MLVSVNHKDAQWGVIENDGFVSGARLCGGHYATLRDLLAAGLAETAVNEAKSLSPDQPVDNLEYLPVIPDPAHILCCGLNYAAHAAETGNAAPEAPRIFLRAPSTLTGHNAPLVRPAASTDFDFEGEIAVIIGKSGRNILESDAMHHVAGYTCFMDGSLRDWQKITTTLGKNFDDTGPLGPGMVLARDVPDWRAFELVTRVNDLEVQRGSAAHMIHTIPAVIALLSQMVELLPGDIIATGTPEGIGCRRDPPLWLKPGDVVEVEVSGIGTLRNVVADA